VPRVPPRLPPKQLAEIASATTRIQLDNAFMEAQSSKRRARRSRWNPVRDLCKRDTIRAPTRSE